MRVVESALGDWISCQHSADQVAFFHPAPERKSWPWTASLTRMRRIWLREGKMQPGVGLAGPRKQPSVPYWHLNNTTGSADGSVLTQEEDEWSS
jgi:hypothetical protein